MTSPRRDIFLGLAVFAGVLALVFGVFRIAQSERSFELDRWETQLHADGDQRLAKVNAWLGDSFGELEAVATNPTVQIYLSEIIAANFDAAKVPEGSAQGAFLNSYIVSLGMRGAFASPSGGLVVLDARRHVVAATPGYELNNAVVAKLIADRRNNESGPEVLRSGNETWVGFLVAVRPPQASGSAAPVGYVIARRKLGAQFWTADGAALVSDHGHESLVLVEKHTESVISASAASVRNRSAGEAEAALTPMHLIVADDFSGKSALHFAQKVKDAPWYVVESIPAKTALAGVEERIRSLVLILLLILIIIIVAVLALWRHTAGVRAVEAREASLKMYRGLIDLLLEAVDEREPGAAAHSRRVAELARKMALIMGAKPVEADAVEMAGALLNVGKLFVPSDLLTRAGALDEAERAQFESGHARWLDLTARLPMDPPLEPILRAALTLMQGGRGLESGPISRDTFIIAAANNTVALMSPRAYRPARNPDEALEILRAGNPAFPKLVLDALCKALGVQSRT
jgi:HD-GYP domain-containing protein (c-di-GMP phosphodiesterase class II)